MRKLLSKKARLDTLAAKVVKSRGFCEAGDKCLSIGSSNPIDKQLTWAHIISRRFLLVRWDPKNAFCLCWGCHRFYTDNPIKWHEFVIEKIGEEAFEALRQKSLLMLKPDYETIFLRLRETIKLMKI